MTDCHVTEVLFETNERYAYRDFVTLALNCHFDYRTFWHKLVLGLNTHKILFILSYEFE